MCVMFVHVFDLSLKLLSTHLKCGILENRRITNKPTYSPCAKKGNIIFLNIGRR